MTLEEINDISLQFCCQQRRRLSLCLASINEYHPDSFKFAGVRPRKQVFGTEQPEHRQSLILSSSG
jgi:hypothetical protein